MKLQISSRLAIFALLELAARPERQMSVAEIGEKHGVSNHHLAKVMHVLGRADLVRAVRGAGGGYQFSGNPRRTTLLDVIQLFEPLGSDDGQPTDCAEEERALGDVLHEVDDIARATLGSITLTTMLKQVERCRANGHRTAAAS
jgi:Rrf2 family protein